MADANDRIIAWFSRHLVTLEASYTVRHQNKPHEQARSYYTGFVLWERSPDGSKGASIWVTAGHCMRQLDEELLGKPDYYSDVRFRFVDTLHAGAVSDLPMPFDYQAQEVKGWMVKTDDKGIESGWDFGVIFLHKHYSRSLWQNKILHIMEDNWSDFPDQFDEYFILGLPGERVGPNEQGVWFATPSIVPIVKLDEKPECYGKHTDPMFYARVDQYADVKNIEGMSGGPVIGLNVNADGIGRYWAIAVQSGWYPRERVICASPLKSLREILTQFTEKVFITKGVDPADPLGWS
jgi:hypothetical protein